MSKSKELWTMPEWMRPYAEFINNTGGNVIEDLVNDEHTDMFGNALRFTLISCVRSQVHLLNALHSEGLLAPVPTEQSLTGSVA